MCALHAEAHPDRLAALAASAGVILLAVVGLVATGQDPAPGDRAGTVGPATPSTTARPAAPSPAREKPVREKPVRLPSGPPQRVEIPSLGLAAAVVPVAARGTSLDPPSDPSVLGWWSGGAWAGAQRGSALVTGHTVHSGGGALDHLERVREGDRVRVRTPRGLIDYVVLGVAVLGKAELARRAPQLFSQVVPGRLVLVTCEDWDGEGYRSNVVVTARPDGLSGRRRG